MAVPVQCHCSAMAVTLQCHGGDMAVHGTVPWQRHCTVPLQCHVTAMAVTGHFDGGTGNHYAREDFIVCCMYPQIVVLVGSRALHRSLE